MSGKSNKSVSNGNVHNVTKMTKAVMNIILRKRLRAYKFTEWLTRTAFWCQIQYEKTFYYNG